MDTDRILVVGSGGIPSSRLLSAEESVVAEAATTVQETIRKLTESGYSAVVCWAERQDELAALIRIRKAQPGVPILLLTPQNDDAFQALARQLGASLVLRPEPTVAETATQIRTTISSGRLARAARMQAELVHRQAKEIRQLVEKTKELSILAKSRIRLPPRLSFIPLVVEGDPEAAFRMVQALEKADVFSPLPILRGRDEAIGYLNDLSRPDAHVLRTMPSLLLIDAELPEGGATAVLKHVRSLCAFAGLPVILMGPPGRNAQMNAAYESGANSYIERATDFEGLVRCVCTLKTYWGSLNHGPGTF